MKKRFFTGSFSPKGEPGICTFDLDPDTGAAVRVSACCEIENPSWLSLDRSRKRLYAVSETEHAGGSVFSLAVRDDGSLSVESSLPLSGAGATHLAFQESFLAAAQYHSGDLDLYSLRADGNLSGHIAHEHLTGHGPVPGRQASPHAHFVAFDPQDERLLWCVDLGSDLIRVYRIGQEGIRMVRTVQIPPGDGPRHLLFPRKHPDLVYCVCEITFRLHVIEKRTGAILWTGDTAEKADPAGGAAAIQSDEEEDTLYVSNRVFPPVGRSSIACFRLDRSGIPRERSILPLAYQMPREAHVFPEMHLMAVAYQRDGRIQLFRLKNGMPDRILSEIPDVPGVSCVSGFLI